MPSNLGLRLCQSGCDLVDAAVHGLCGLGRSGRSKAMCHETAVFVARAYGDDEYVLALWAMGVARWLPRRQCMGNYLTFSTGKSAPITIEISTAISWLPDSGNFDSIVGSGTPISTNQFFSQSTVAGLF
jgi:hypothetical protein